MPEIQRAYVAEPLPQDLRAVLERTADELEVSITVTGFDGQWVTFLAPHLTDKQFFEQMYRARKEILGFDIWRYQILCPSNASHRGLFIQSLSDDESRQEYQAGFHYY